MQTETDSTTAIPVFPGFSIILPLHLKGENMKKIITGFSSNFIACLTILTLAIPYNVISAFAASAAEPAQTKVKHNRLKYVVPGKRIAIEARITDPEGIKLARCYFKAEEEANFVFVPMVASGSTYNAVLPAPSDKTTGLKYVFLSVNSRNQVARTQEFEVPVDKDKKDETPKWQMDKDKQPVKVSVETNKAPSKVAGFSDSIKCDAVESAARFGLVVGLGGAAAYATAGGGGGGGAAAASGTTVTATSTGMSTTAIVVTAGALAVAAVGGGVAAASGGSGGGGGNDNGGTTLTNQSIVASWGVTGSNVGSGATSSGSIQFNQNGSYSYSLRDVFPSGAQPVATGSGSWNLNGSSLTLSFDKGAVYQGTATGNSTAFTMNSSNGWTLNFTRR
jgi:hypothetical protein